MVLHELILQICIYVQKRRIWRENCKHALDESFHCHFCSRRKAAKFRHPGCCYLSSVSGVAEADIFQQTLGWGTWLQKWKGFWVNNRQYWWQTIGYHGDNSHFAKSIPFKVEPGGFFFAKSKLNRMEEGALRCQRCLSIYVLCIYTCIWWIWSRNGCWGGCQGCLATLYAAACAPINSMSFVWMISAKLSIKWHLSLLEFEIYTWIKWSYHRPSFISCYRSY